jgi:hypothetical protein
MIRVFNAETKEQATECIDVDYDEQDEMVAETWAKTSPRPRQ